MLSVRHGITRMSKPVEGEGVMVAKKKVQE